jgi:hypothetical protein
MRWEERNLHKSHDLISFMKLASADGFGRFQSHKFGAPGFLTSLKLFR